MAKKIIPGYPQFVLNEDGSVDVNAQVKNVVDPTAAQDAATKNYADTHAPIAHAATHKDGGADELDVSELAGALGGAGEIPESDGAAVAWVDPDSRYDPKVHAASHTDGTDDIQESSTAQKGICQLDDTPVSGELNEPITSNRMYDHENAPEFTHFLHFLRARGFIHLLQFDDDNWTDTAGTTDITRETQMMNIKVTNGDTEAGFSKLDIQGGVIGHGITGYFNYDKEAFFQLTVLRLTAEANAEAVIQIKDDPDASVPLIDEGFGIKIANMVLSGHSYGGGVASGDLTLNTTMVNNDAYLIGIHLKPTEFIKWYVNGVLQATETVDLPAGIGNAFFVIGYKTTGAAGADNYLYVANPMLIQAI